MRALLHKSNLLKRTSIIRTPSKQIQNPVRELGGTGNPLGDGGMLGGIRLGGAQSAPYRCMVRWPFEILNRMSDTSTRLAVHEVGHLKVGVDSIVPAQACDDLVRHHTMCELGLMKLKNIVNNRSEMLS